jgi:hypothetical protein
MQDTILVYIYDNSNFTQTIWDEITRENHNKRRAPPPTKKIPLYPPSGEPTLTLISFPHDQLLHFNADEDIIN